MKGKIICILVMTLLITTVIPISGGNTDDEPNTMIDESKSLIGMLSYGSYNLPSEEYEMKQKSVYREVPLDKGWYWLQSYPNYAPSGMPDFYQLQDQWQSIKCKK